MFCETTVPKHFTNVTGKCSVSFEIELQVVSLLKSVGDEANAEFGESTPNFPKNKHFLPPDKRFLGRFDVVCFLVTSVLRFALLLYHRRNKLWHCSFPVNFAKV